MGRGDRGTGRAQARRRGCRSGPAGVLREPAGGLQGPQGDRVRSGAPADRVGQASPAPNVMKRALVIIALLLPAPASAATTYTVGPGQSIAGALATAADGDTIHVLPGTYVEQPLTVDHAVRIEGEPGTV